MRRLAALVAGSLIVASACSGVIGTDVRKAPDGLGTFVSTVTVEGDVGWAGTCSFLIGLLGTPADAEVCRTVLGAFRVID